MTMEQAMAMPGDDRAGAASFDAEIVRRVLGGEVDAFEQLVDRHRQRVFAIVARHVPGGSVADVAHDVFVDAYRSLGTFRFEKPFEHWLARIAVRRSIDYWRGQGRRREQPVSSLTDDQRGWVDRVLAAPSREAFEAETARREAREVVDWALAQLGAKDRMAVSLLHLEGYSVKEASALLGWSVPNTKIRAMRARHALRKILGRLVEGTSDAA